MLGISNFAIPKEHPLQKIAVYTLVLLYLGAMVRPIAPVLEYVINEDYIAEFLCVNQNKKELQCRGKCYLMQQISKQNEEKGQNLPKIAMEEYPIGFVNLLAMPQKKSEIGLVEINFTYLNPYSFLFTSTSFHPPNFRA